MFRYGNPIGVFVLSVLGLIVWILGYRLVKVSYRTSYKGDMLHYE